MRLTPDNSTRLDEAKDNLKQASEYTRAQEKCVLQKTDTTTLAAEEEKSRLVWATVNSMTNRKSTRGGQLKGENSKERM